MCVYKHEYLKDSLKLRTMCVMGKRRTPCCHNSQVLKRGPWSDEESERLKAFILKHGHHNWRSLPKLAGQSFIKDFFCLMVNLIVFFPLKIISITLHVRSFSFQVFLCL